MRTAGWASLRPATIRSKGNVTGTRRVAIAAGLLNVRGRPARGGSDVGIRTASDG